ncbi:MAG TPA: O-antigen ligase family protein [Anaerolineae bacterium]|nr:O-antigen ligase family protein [Anaerolineae bacterium]
MSTIDMDERRWLVAAAALGLLAGASVFLTQVSVLLAAATLAALALLAALLMGWPFSGVVALILAALITRYRIDIGPVTVRPEHVAAVVVAGVGFLQLGLERRAPRVTAAIGFAVAWWVANLISGIWLHPDRFMGLQNVLRIALLPLTFFLVFNLIPNARAWHQAVVFFLAAGLAEAAFGILARAVYPFGINLGVQVAWNFPVPVPYGTFEEGNLFGSHSASWAILLLMILLAAAQARAPRKHQLMRMLGLGVLLMAVGLSMSRAAWIMLVIGATAVIIFERPSPWSQVNRLLLAAIALPMLIFILFSITPYLPPTLPFVNRLQSFLNLEYDPTFSARLSDWSLALQDWRERPFTGWGPGSFFALHGYLRARPAWISNLTVRLLQETGVMGLITFAGFFITLLAPGIKVARQQGNVMKRGMLLGLVISYAALVGLAYQSTDGIWLTASWVHAGLIAAGTYVLRKDQRLKIKD